MTEVTLQCQSCHSRLTTRWPDAMQGPDGTLIRTASMAYEDVLSHLMAFMKCSVCEDIRWTLLEERIETRNLIPVYVGYVLYLERYVSIETDSMEEAVAQVKAMLRSGQVRRPSYTERLDDWTQIVDQPQRRGHFVIDGETI